MKFFVSFVLLRDLRVNAVWIVGRCMAAEGRNGGRSSFGCGIHASIMQKPHDQDVDGFNHLFDSQSLANLCNSGGTLPVSALAANGAPGKPGDWRPARMLEEHSRLTNPENRPPAR
jgi:hypothetical protein